MKNIETSETGGTVAISESSIQVVVSLVGNIVDMACEHEPDLSLMRLVNFMDLYRTYLAHEMELHNGDGEPAVFAGGPAGRRMTECVSFENFIGDSHLLQLAASVASRDTGVFVAAPLPLKISANGS